jgi:hypothetical protein
VIALQLHERGLAHRARARGRGAQTPELAIRVRVAVRSVNALVAERRLLNPLR